ncbi:MAG: small nuclear RNA activating complex, polypeptide 3 [Marteilia pararefringens]
MNENNDNSPTDSPETKDEDCLEKPKQFEIRCETLHKRTREALDLAKLTVGNSARDNAGINKLWLNCGSQYIDETTFLNNITNDNVLSSSRVTAKQSNSSTSRPKKTYSASHKYQIFESVAMTRKMNQSELEKYPFLMNIRFYQPLMKNIPLTYQYDLVASTTNTLEDLQSFFHCPNDFDPLVDCQNNPTCDVDSMRGKLLPHWYIQVDRTVYVKSYSLNFQKTVEDLVENLRNFYSRKNNAPLAVKNIENIALRDIDIKLGGMYLYSHVDGCEHMFCFTKLFEQTDFESKYLTTMPMIVTKHNTRRVMCRICDAIPACWSVRGFKLTPEHQVYLCDRCMRSFCYIDEKPSSTFILQHYLNGETKIRCEEKN